MSDPIDIKALEEYLKGGSDVSRRYRDLGGDAVPPELDQRVLAAARDAVAKDGVRRSRSWLRWSATVALAASVVLVVTVVREGGLQDQQMATVPQAPVEAREAAPAAAAANDKARDANDERKLAQELRKEQGVVQEVAQSAREVVQSPPPAPLAASEPAPAAATVAKAKAERFNQAPAISDVAVTESRQSGAETESALPVTTVAQEQIAVAAQRAPEADSSADLQEVQVTGARRARSVGRNAGPRNTISASAFRNDRPASDEEADHSDPKAWLEAIRGLRRAGKTADADREWEQFHEAFPDFHVADDDLARKRP